MINLEMCTAILCKNLLCLDYDDEPDGHGHLGAVKDGLGALHLLLGLVQSLLVVPAKW